MTTRASSARKATPPPQNGAPQSGARGVPYIRSTKEFERLVGRSTYTIVYFTAGWCNPCKKISPVYEECHAKDVEGLVETFKVDVDECQDVCTSNNVAKMPTFQMWYANSPIYITEGADAANLRAFVEHAHAMSRGEVPAS